MCEVVRFPGGGFAIVCGGQMPDQTITFALDAGAANIVKRSARALGLRVVDQAPAWGTRVSDDQSVFVVFLNESIDAYRLGERCVGDPGWAKEFLRR
jgi:Flp pilus assembly CpaF family ATPase